MQLSKNFNLVELTKSQTAERKGIPNDPSPDHLENLRLLCERVLQPVRDHFNHVVSVSSWISQPSVVSQPSAAALIRSMQKAWQRTSKSTAHLTMKFLIGSRTTFLYDQMILEFWNKDEPNSGWLHVSYNPESSENIKENLRAYKDEDNITRYKPIIGDA